MALTNKDIATIRNVVRQILDEDGANVDNYAEVERVDILDEETAAHLSMPLVQRNDEGIAQQYRQTKIDTIAAFVAKMVTDKYPDVEEKYARINEILEKLDGLDDVIQFATDDEVKSVAEALFND